MTRLEGPADRRGSAIGAQPTWMPPMLATLAEDAAAARAEWLYEPKLDGVRVLIYVSRGQVRLFSRNRKPLDAAYPELVEALSIAGPGRRGARW